MIFKSFSTRCRYLGAYFAIMTIAVLLSLSFVYLIVDRPPSSVFTHKTLPKPDFVVYGPLSWAACLLGDGSVAFLSAHGDSIEVRYFTSPEKPRSILIDTAYGKARPLLCAVGDGGDLCLVQRDAVCIYKRDGVIPLPYPIGVSDSSVVSVLASVDGQYILVSGLDFVFVWDASLNRIVYRNIDIRPKASGFVVIETQLHLAYVDSGASSLILVNMATFDIADFGIRNVEKVVPVPSQKCLALKIYDRVDDVQIKPLCVRVIQGRSLAGQYLANLDILCSVLSITNGPVEFYVGSGLNADSQSRYMSDTNYVSASLLTECHESCIGIFKIATDSSSVAIYNASSLDRLVRHH